MNISIRK